MYEPILDTKTTEKRYRVPLIVIILFILCVAAIIILCLIEFDVFSSDSSNDNEMSEPIYNFTIERLYITIPARSDAESTNLSLTLVEPVPLGSDPDETFPVLFEFLPYRKDDSFYIRDYPMFHYFGKRGYIVARVDIRGTGSSYGTRVPKEYSTIELNDAIYIIQYLSKLDLSNGKVGLYGKSWSAFNALMLVMIKGEYAMKGYTSENNPLDALKAICVFHGSEDLYYNDIHYIDGVLHQDEYIMEIDHENGLPNSLNGYELNEDYFQTRFTQLPWIYTYMEHQVDGAFWRNNSVGFHYEALNASNVPMYLWAGQLDGYRDFAVNIYENTYTAVNNMQYNKITIGPWKHDFPSDAIPGPEVEWKYEATRWFDVWTKDYDNDIIKEPNVNIYFRHYYSPSENITEIPGDWRSFDTWPLQNTSVTDQWTWRKFYLTSNSSLGETYNKDKNETVKLTFYPSAGTTVVTWWGGRHGDQKSFDNHSLYFDSTVLTEMVEIVGNVKIHLKLKTTQALTFWNVRLEDVDTEDGQIFLVTGADRNGAQRDNRTNPSDIPINEWFTLDFNLHFTTWRFIPGHKIRISISNAMFRTLWSTPNITLTSFIAINSNESYVSLPAMIYPTSNTSVSQPYWVTNDVPIENASPDDACYYDYGTDYNDHQQVYITYDNSTKYVHTFWKEDYYYFVENRMIYSSVDHNFTIDNDKPQYYQWEAHARQFLRFDQSSPSMFNGTCIVDSAPILPSNPIFIDNNSSNSSYSIYENTMDLQSHLILRSDKDTFYCYWYRTVYKNGSFVANRTFNRNWTRNFQ